VLGTVPLESARGTALPVGEEASAAKLQTGLRYPVWRQALHDGPMYVFWEDPTGVCVAEVCFHFHVLAWNHFLVHPHLFGLRFSLTCYNLHDSCCFM
jgi:hypothetical protein